MVAKESNFIQIGCFFEKNGEKKRKKKERKKKRIPTDGPNFLEIKLEGNTGFFFAFVLLCFDLFCSVFVFLFFLFFFNSTS